MVKQTNGVHDATFSIETQSNKRLLLQPADMCFESDRLEAGPSTTTIPSLMSTLCPFDDLSTEERMTHAASGLPWKVRGRLVQISPLSMSSQMTATGSFGVAFNSDQRDFHAFNTLFNHFYSQRDAKPLANAQVGSYCAFYASQSWLRGVIVRVSVQHCLVAAIDTGLELCLNHDKLFHLASNFSELPFALRCVYPTDELDEFMESSTEFVTSLDEKMRSVLI
uniref:Tudor domain-containing protein n=1 Tax=Plectus sambesii TaxID=2011161 RepID=A0A914X369_9BILA